MSGSLGRDYRTLLAALTLSNLADGMIRAALPLLAVRLTASATLVATVTMVATLPWLVFALPAGAVIDRVDRRATLRSTNAVRVVLLGGFAAIVWVDAAELWTLWAIAIALGLLETFSDLAGETIVPSVVDREQLEQANAGVYAARLTMNEFAGPAAGGALAGIVLVLPFVGGAAAYAGAVGALLGLRGHHRPDRTRPSSVRHDIGDGLRRLLGNPTLRSLAFASAASNLGVGIASSVLVVYAVAPGPLGMSDAGYGMLLGAAGAGGLAGATVAGHLVERLGRRVVLTGGTVVLALATAAPALTTNIGIVGVLTFAGGLASVLWGVTSRSLRQRITPDEILGRINAAFQLVSIGMYPLGAAVASLLTNMLTVRAVIAIAGAATMAGVLALVALRNNHLDPTTAADRDDRQSPADGAV
jgi:MFS family permease